MVFTPNVAACSFEAPGVSLSGAPVASLSGTEAEKVTQLWALGGVSAWKEHDGESFTLVVKTPDREVSKFVGQPSRTLEQVALHELVALWHEPELDGDPPNALITVSDQAPDSRPLEARVELTSATYDSAHDLLRFGVRDAGDAGRLAATLERPATNIAVLIDPYVAPPAQDVYDVSLTASRPAEYEFELPNGFVDPETGALHRVGRMRLATAADEILPLKDHRVQHNPAFLNVIVISRVIVQLGSLDIVTTRVIEQLSQEDFAYLKSMYDRINDWRD
jgi:hypothetical protein